MKAPVLIWEELKKEGVLAGFTEAGNKGDFNLALHAGGEPSRVLENRRSLCETLNLPFSSYTCAEQIHGTKITLVKKEDRGRGRLTHNDALPGTDSLICDTPGILLNIYVADCVPIILYDKNGRAGALCHGGWRGTAGLIVIKTIQAMAENFKSRPEDIWAFIGPSIGPCCYDVGEMVEKSFKEQFHYRDDPFHGKNKKLFLDLKKANRLQLLEAGVRDDRIKVSSHCTFCSEKTLFSYRKSGAAAGRFSAFISL
ncbi:MAG: peptidoglycan editing factor PgeF [Spirochaetales bacterium]|nr:peptidoglycan editing factor PgeF [Spirochaetales bacterium]